MGGLVCVCNPRQLTAITRLAQTPSTRYIKIEPFIAMLPSCPQEYITVAVSLERAGRCSGRLRHRRKCFRPVLSIRVAGQVAELADALDLGSSGATHQSSSLCLPTCERAEPAAREIIERDMKTLRSRRL